MGFLDNLLSTGAQVTGIEKSRQALLDAGSAAQTGAAQIGGTAAGMSQFQPFTVTGGTGSITTDAQGGFGMQLSPQQQALQSNMFGAAQGLSGQIGQPVNPMYGQMANQAYGQAQGALGQAGQIDPQMAAQRAAMSGLFNQQAMSQGQFDTAGREADVYGRLRAMQTPGEERQRLALQEQLQAQGRGGIQTAQYGGTPEQLAMAKAQAEAQNQAGLMAMQQAQTEKQQGLSNLYALQGADQTAAAQQQALQRGNLGLASGLFDYGTASSMQPGQMTQQQLQNQAAMMSAGYDPERQMLDMLGAGTSISQVADLGRRAAAEQYAEANMSGLEGMLQSRQGAADLNQRYYEALAGLANSQNAQGQGMASQVGGFLSNLVGGGGGGGGINIGNLPIFNTESLTSNSSFANSLSDYLGGTGTSSGTSGLLGDSFNITDMFDYGGTPTAGGGTFFGSGTGTNFDFGSTFDPYDLGYSAGGGNPLGYDSSTAFTFPSGGG